MDSRAKLTKFKSCHTYLLWNHRQVLIFLIFSFLIYKIVLVVVPNL